MRCPTAVFFDILYLVTWIFIGNYIFLNLFLAILLEGFTGESTNNNLDDFELKEKTEKAILEFFVESYINFKGISLIKKVQGISGN